MPGGGLKCVVIENALSAIKMIKDAGGSQMLVNFCLTQYTWFEIKKKQLQDVLSTVKGYSVHHCLRVRKIQPDIFSNSKFHHQNKYIFFHGFQIYR